MFPVAATCARAAGAKPTAASRTRARARHADLIVLLSDCPWFGRALREQAEDGGAWCLRRTARARGGAHRGAKAGGGEAEPPFVHASDDRLERLAQRRQAVAGLAPEAGRDGAAHDSLPLHVRELPAQRLLR